jgi:flagella basal body P-ring formation protein FlgA
VSCLTTLTPLVAGALADDAAFQKTRCTADAVALAFRYDPATGAVHLARALDIGAVVPEFPGYGTAMVRPGQVLRLVVQVGSVRIDRDVEALQAAHPGQRLFVRAHDGTVLSVRFESLTP